MRRIFFIALMLTVQLFAQMDEGLYKANEIYMSDVNNRIRYNVEEIKGTQYIDVTDNGIRIFDPNGLGVYHGWKYIGEFLNYETYLLTNNSKVCIAPEIDGIFYFYEYEYDHLEFKRLIEFRNIKKVSNKKSNNYLMQLR